MSDPTTPSSPPPGLIAPILAGDVRAAARLMRDVDDRRPAALAALKELHAHTGRAYVLGVTGNPGAGKSTVVDALITHYRAAGARVGVVAVDPTSPFTGGAILGDRIRMQRHALDDGVFIRSLATPGGQGAIAERLETLIQVVEAFGFEVIVVETVGAGQGDTAVHSLADVVLLLLQPESGDDLQFEKAGLLEVADVVAVHKADLPGAEFTAAQVRSMLDLARESKTPVLQVSSKARQGVAELWQAIQSLPLRRAVV